MTDMNEIRHVTLWSRSYTSACVSTGKTRSLPPFRPLSLLLSLLKLILRKRSRGRPRMVQTMAGARKTGGSPRVSSSLPVLLSLPIWIPGESEGNLVGETTMTKRICTIRMESNGIGCAAINLYGRSNLAGGRASKRASLKAAKTELERKNERTNASIRSFVSLRCASPVAATERQELHCFDNFVLYARYIVPPREKISASEGGYRGSKSFLFTTTASRDKRILPNEECEIASDPGKSAEKFGPKRQTERNGVRMGGSRKSLSSRR